MYIQTCLTTHEKSLGGVSAEDVLRDGPLCVTCHEQSVAVGLRYRVASKQHGFLWRLAAEKGHINGVEKTVFHSAMCKPFELDRC